MANWAAAHEMMPALFGGDPGSSGPPAMPPSAAPPMGQRSHAIDFEIFGDDMQIVEVELDPGETVIAEAGAMNYMEDDITFVAKMGDGSNPTEGIMGKLLAVGKRALTGSIEVGERFFAVARFGGCHADPQKFFGRRLAQLDLDWLAACGDCDFLVGRQRRHSVLSNR